MVTVGQVEMEGIWHRVEQESKSEIGKHWALRKNSGWLNSVVSAVFKLDQVTKHLEFMMLSAKQRLFVEL